MTVPPPLAFKVVPVKLKFVPRVISSITPVPEVPRPTNLFVETDVVIVPLTVIIPPEINPAVDIDVTVPVAEDSLFPNNQPNPLLKKLIYLVIKSFRSIFPLSKRIFLSLIISII